MGQQLYRSAALETGRGACVYQRLLAARQHRRIVSLHVVLNASTLTELSPSLAANRYVWPKNWGPTYRHSYAICIATNGLTIVMCFIFKKHLESLNRKLEQKEQEEGRPHGFRYLS